MIFKGISGITKKNQRAIEDSIYGLLGMMKCAGCDSMLITHGVGSGKPILVIAVSEDGKECEIKSALMNSRNATNEEETKHEKENL